MTKQILINYNEHCAVLAALELVEAKYELPQKVHRRKIGSRGRRVSPAQDNAPIFADAGKEME